MRNAPFLEAPSRGPAVNGSLARAQKGDPVGYMYPAAQSQDPGPDGPFVSRLCQLCVLRQATPSLSLDPYCEVVAVIITSSWLVTGLRQPQNDLSTWHSPDSILANQLLLVFAGLEGEGNGGGRTQGILTMMELSCLSL